LPKYNEVVKNIAVEREDDMLRINGKYEDEQKQLK